MDSQNIITARDVRKIYRSKAGEVHALDGLDLDVPAGTVRALLGPNGAGKTTMVKVLTTLTRPDSGAVMVAGTNVLVNPAQTRRLIGASGQYAAVDENLTGFENLEMIGRLYHLGRRRSVQRADELIDRFGLITAARRPVKGFSGGMRRRIDLACAIVNEPKVLFLDEPTTGLDPRSRQALWEIIRELVGQGTTLLLTTQYLEEADQLADTVSVIDGGRVIAEGTPDQLKAQTGGHRVVVTLAEESDIGTVVSVLRAHGDGEPVIAVDGRTVEVPVASGTHALQTCLAALGSAQVVLLDAGIRRPTLDDVFLRLTGQRADIDPAAPTDDEFTSTDSRADALAGASK